MPRAAAAAAAAGDGVVHTQPGSEAEWNLLCLVGVTSGFDSPEKQDRFAD